MRKAYLILMLLVVTIFQPFYMEQAHACSCAETVSVEDELENKAVVFSGVVMAMKEVPGTGNKEVLLDVTSYWKGGDESQILVVTTGDSAACGFEFRGGKEYLGYPAGILGILMPR